MTRYAIIVEGRTEVRLLKILLEYCQEKKEDAVNDAKGKGKLWGTTADILRPYIGSGERYSTLIFRDHDKDDGGIPNILSEFEKGFRDLLKDKGFEETVSFQQSDSENIFSYSLVIPEKVDVRLFFHIAKPPKLSTSLEGYPFDNATTDHYTLVAALTEGVVARFAEEAGMSPEALVTKVTQEIPHLLRMNGLEDIGIKDIVSGYMTASRFLKIKGSEREESFTGIVVDRVLKYEKERFEQIFASHIAAIKMLLQ